MDSQLTLVNPAPPLLLTFSANSMSNATLFSDRQAVYTLSTQLTRADSVTELRRVGDSAVVARISRKSILPDTVAFPAAPDEGSGNVREVKTSKWMKKCKLADGTQAHAFDTEMGQCLLRRHLQYRLALFTEFDTETPIAHWEKGSSPPSLLISSSVPEAFHPQVICAFIIEEFKMRMAEKADVIAQGKALAQSTPLARIR
ncbi:hypothetical protein HMN09_01095900 [Mycena chlorophos]|uniref:DUF6593 domain-containing protein n=1 Tax=Mycena chlorophos TaxID=658473 RepID=A0A8H6VY98_MYCCL|nr:hypothetical protein HMN09_01095900 [Mycena chlorophos]